MLNEFQQQVLQCVVNSITLNIVESDHVSTQHAILALRSVRNNALYTTYHSLLESLDLLVEQIDRLREIYSHPCPQNPHVGCPYLGYGDDGYDECADEVVLSTGEQGSTIIRMKRGLLGLTSLNDTTTVAVTKRDVINYVGRLLDTELVRLYQLNAEEQMEVAPVEENLPVAELPRVDFSTLSFSHPLHMLESGNYGDVFLGEWQGKQVAIKKVRLTNESEVTRLNTIAYKQFCCESTQVIRLFGVSSEPGRFVMISEHMKRGTLHNVLYDFSQKLPWKIRWQIALDVSTGLAYIHNKRFLHRDLCSGNILLDEKYGAKISNPGMGGLINDIYRCADSPDRVYPSSSIRWRAPEQIKIPGIYFTSPADVYSLGVVMLELAARKIPFAEKDNITVLRLIEQSQASDFLKSMMPQDTPETYKSLTFKSLHRICGERPRAHCVQKQLQQHQSTIGEFYGEYEFILGLMKFEKAQYASAITDFERAAALDFPPAFYFILHTRMIINQSSIKVEAKDSLLIEKILAYKEWIIAHAKKGHVNGQLVLGYLHYRGLAVEQNYTAAEHWWKKAAEKCDVKINAQLGVAQNAGGSIIHYALAMLYKNKSTELQDSSKSNQMMKKAAKGANTQAFLKLAMQHSLSKRKI